MKLAPRDLRCEYLDPHVVVLFFEELASEPTASERCGHDGLSRTAFTDDELLIEFVAWTFWYSVQDANGHCNGHFLLFPLQESIDRKWEPVPVSITLDDWANALEPNQNRPSFYHGENDATVAFPRSIVDIRYLLSMRSERIVIPRIGEAGRIFFDTGEMVVAVFMPEPQRILDQVAHTLNLKPYSDEYSQYLKIVFEGEYLPGVVQSTKKRIDSAGAIPNI